ncbi:MAG: DUF4339 domain-containing protein [Alphaproteobacteria bacterium]|nr:DUF4339 domain-containing protein [Alphaproteobacteria bacterium]MBU6471143.1 DUF4339 domain-containing protein [Alphaproteobacteria bacterium]MDE2013098.1 DUF4339 domain-containing protein [Alphaproteobacteria bacterium]MDE2074393.1 DUF4339 domain-containing protein [Alphaproteobacteria bacterium]MDE2351918.1 DUF4339 domain-containing protein [Alphaproteobacteria bacterium]
MDEMWFVSVGGRSYGPYPLDQMRGFIAEGRVLPQSLVGQPDSESLAPAGDDPVLGPLFQPAPVRTSAISQPLKAPEPAPRRFGQDDATEETSHIVVIADMKSGSINGMEETLFNLGQVSQVMPQVWLLATNRSVNGVRNALMQKLGKIDMLFLVDSTHDKVAWHNFGPEAESRIRRIWARPRDTERKAG